MKKWKKSGTAGLLTLLLVTGTLSGCGGQAALEDRTYVESLHILPTGEAYQYQCILAYVDSDSMKYFKAGFDGAVMENGSTEPEEKKNTEMPEKENTEMSEKNTEMPEEKSKDAEGDSSGAAGEGDSEYIAVASNMEEFNQEYYRLTGSNFDYSHLQGIYLDASLYQPGQAEGVLEDIRETTQAVLSTPVYQEGVEIGDQEEATLGDWLKAGR